MSDVRSEQVSRCSWCPSPCKSCTEDRDCECYTHQDEPDRDALAADLASETIRLHPDHGSGHELRCVTFACPRYETNLVKTGSASERLDCLARHAVRCIDCHTWADLPKHVAKPKPLRPVADALALDQGDQMSLFRGGDNRGC